MKSYSSVWVSQTGFPGYKFWAGFAWRMFIRSVLGINICERGSKDAELGRRSQAATAAQWQPWLTSWRVPELEGCFRTFLRWSGFHILPCWLWKNHKKGITLDMGPSRGAAILEETEIYCWHPSLQLGQTLLLLKRHLHHISQWTPSGIGSRYFGLKNNNFKVSS